MRTMKNTENAACLGAAILAGVGAKVWDNAVAAAQQFTENDLEYLPNPNNWEIYQTLLDQYKKLLNELAASFER